MNNKLEYSHLFHLYKACDACSPEEREAVDFYGNTALLKACYLGNLEAVHILLTFKVNLHAINYFGQNALTLATYSGSKATVIELLKRRSYADFALSSIIPPLCVAMLRGHQHLVEHFESIQPEQKYKVLTVHGVSAGELQDMHGAQQNDNQNA